MGISVKAACLSFALFLFIVGLALSGLVLGDPFWADAPSQPTPIYIRSDGAIEPSNVPIQRSGRVYTFTGDALNSSLIVEADNVVVDGAGFLLQGNGITGNYLNIENVYVGISLTNRNNVTIKNTVIKAFDLGIRVASSSEINLVGNQVYEKTRLCNSSSNCQLTGNILSMVEVQSSLNTIANNNFTLSSSYLSIEANNNTVNENLFHTNIRICEAHYNIVSKNTIVSLGLTGVELSHLSSHNEVFGNEISLSAYYGGGVVSSSGVHVSYAANENAIYNNTIRNADIGILVSNNVINNLFYRNKMENVSESVHIDKPYTTSELGFNSWDNGREGNYWSDYTGTDTNGDGIGDTPYVINANNIDHCPLMPYYEPDVTSPLVSFVSPENKTYYGGNITLTFTVNENVSWMGYSLDGQDNVTLLGNSTISNLLLGVHNIKVYANDAAGNIGATETLYFSIETPKPFPTTFVVASVILVAVIGSGLIVYFRKRKRYVTPTTSKL